MTAHPYYPHLAIASPSEIERTARQLAEVRRAFLKTGLLPEGLLRPVIHASWQRCYGLSVNPAQRRVPLAVADDSQLGDLRAASEPLLWAVGPVLRRLADFFAGSGYVIALADPDGRLLEVVGDPSTCRQLEQIDFVPGADISEAAAGTNAIGTALTVSHAVQLLGAEHYCDGWQAFTCTAMPIHHPHTGETLGGLDVSGDYHLIRPFFTTFLTVAALEVQQKLQTRLNPPHPPPAPFQIAAVSVPASAHALDDLQTQLDFQERRARDAERLAAAASVVSASLDVEITLEQMAEQAARLLGLNSVAIGLFDEAGEAVSLHLWPKPTSPLPAGLLRETSTVALLRERGEPVRVDDVRAAPELLPEALLAQMNSRSFVLLPLTAVRGVIGFLVASRATPYHWEADDLRLGLALAVQAATALEHARLFGALQQHNRHVETLNAISQILSALLDPSQHLDLILQRLTAIMELDASLVFLRDPSAGGLTLAAHCGLPENMPPDFDSHALRPLGEILGRAATQGESLLLNGLRPGAAVSTEALQSVGFSEAMIVPLAVGRASLGVLVIGSYPPRGLTDDDLTLFTNIGQQIGLALKNAQWLREANEIEALRGADRLKSRFLMTVSHDLRSPLTAIRMSVESLLERGGVQSAPEPEHLLHNIASQAGRLGRLVDQLLDLSRIEAGALALDRDWTELAALIADTLVKFEALNNCCVARRPTMSLPLVYVDPDRLVQVLWNLLENACKYGPPGAPITVEAQWTGGEVLISVADRGPGVPPEECERIFQYFYRLNRDQRAHPHSSGLGLAICHGIVEAHGGRLWVEDRPGGGSTFCVALPPPTADPASLAALEGHEPGDPHAGEPPR